VGFEICNWIHLCLFKSPLVLCGLQDVVVDSTVDLCEKLGEGALIFLHTDIR
jgi:hypothetical protein